eukprot:10421071-Heterocapsa_arctica.AAC.1
MTFLYRPNFETANQKSKAIVILYQIICVFAYLGSCCGWPGRERPEVHFASLFTVLGARRAPRGPL